MPYTTATEASSAGNYAPSVPISVYRELATELQTTKAMVDALSRQNQQLTRQNKLLRNEIYRFVQSAEQLGQFAGLVPQDSAVAPEARSIPRVEIENLEDDPSLELTATAPSVIPQDLAIVPREREAQSPPRDGQRPRPKVSSPKPKLFTEQRDDYRRSHAPSPRSQDLGNLWLVTTILLVVFTAFGAGFLIMRPLLNR